MKQILRSFLCKGDELNSAGGKGTWSFVFLPKKEGGLCVKNLKMWNKVAMLKHVWLCSNNANSIWSSWVNAISHKCASRMS